MLLAGHLGPGQPTAANQTAVHKNSIGPAKGDGARGRGMYGERIPQSVQSGIEGTAGQAERLFRLKHHGEFHNTEATDTDQRASPLPGGNGLGVAEGLAHFPELDQPKWGRKVYGDLQFPRATRHACATHARRPTQNWSRRTGTVRPLEL